MNSIIYYLGIFSCAMQGAEKGKDDHFLPIHRYVLNSFGGGFIRDYILAVTPWLFTKDALFDLKLVIFVGCIYSYYLLHPAHKEHKKFVDIIILLTDALGLGSFIAIGMNKAFICTDNPFVIIICGYVTAIGGGILASDGPLLQVFQNVKTVMYHLVTMLCCCFYYVTKFEMGLVIFTTMSILLINIDIYHVWLSVCFPFIEYKPYIKASIQMKEHFYYDFQAKKRYTSKFCPKTYLSLKFPKRYLMLRRIRQC